MNIKTGVILAAGKGSRLSSVTRAVPKELLTIGNVPIIEHSVSIMKMAGIEKLIVVVGYHKKAIIDYLGSGQRYGLDIAYVFQEEQCGTGDALLYAESFVGENFCLLFGDDYLEPDNCLKILLERHIKENSIASIGISKVDDARTTSVMRLKDDKVLEIVEKPDQKELWGNFGSNGSFVLNRRIFDSIRKTEPGLANETYLSEAINNLVVDGNKVVALQNTDYYMDIGIIERYLSANERFFKKNYNK